MAVPRSKSQVGAAGRVQSGHGISFWAASETGLDVWAGPHGPARYAVRMVSVLSPEMAACAAASRAIGTR